MWGKKSKCSICGHRIYFWSAGSTHKIYTNLSDISSNCNKNVLIVLLPHRGVPGLDGALGDIVGTFRRPPVNLQPGHCSTVPPYSRYAPLSTMKTCYFVGQDVWKNGSVFTSNEWKSGWQNTNSIHSEFL